MENKKIEISSIKKEKLLNKIKGAIMKIAKNENFWKLTFKILHDALFLLLIIFFALLSADSVLPGIFSSEISFTKIIFLIISVLGIIYYLANKKINFEERGIFRINLAMKIILLILVIGFMANSLIKFTTWQNIIITSISVALLYFFYKLLMEKKGNL